MKKINSNSALSLLAALTLAGCSASQAPDHTPEKFMHATRQNAPAPVYNRERLVYLPEVLPVSDTSMLQDRVRILPAFKVAAKQKPLERVALELASVSGYHSYCASTVADRKVSLRAQGTLDQLGQQIADDVGVDVVIDHERKELRFLARELPAPSFPTEVSSTQVYPQGSQDGLSNEQH